MGGGTDKTSWLEGLEHDDGAAGGPSSDGLYTESLDGGWTGKTSANRSEEKTVLSRGGQQDDRTQIAIGRRLEDDNDAAMDDPVTGWLVVVQGPGQGRSATVGAGMNTIGRSEDERISLPFGDMQISAKDHLRIIYDDQARSFMVIPGTGKNISRIGGQIIAMPMPLENYATIHLSKNTVVRFAAFCTESFDWSEATTQAGSSKA
jgi:hypothetical protein